MKAEKAYEKFAKLVNGNVTYLEDTWTHTRVQAVPVEALKQFAEYLMAYIEAEGEEK